MANGGAVDDTRTLPMLTTVDEAAVLLRTTRKAVYCMIESRRLPGVVRIGRRVLIRTAELLDWLRQNSECHR
jgi:excisionase family DNA binding protein